MTSAVATILGVLVGIAIGRLWRSDARAVHEIDLTTLPSRSQRRAWPKERR